jgi:pimeloyl-ACP methyl ester carboxylesterase
MCAKGSRPLGSLVPLVILTVLLSLVPATWVQPAEVVMQDGRVFRGLLGPPIPSLSSIPKTLPADGSGPPRLILFVDDNLRRTFVPKSQRQLREVRQDDPGEVEEKFVIRQRTLRNGPTVKTIGPIISVAPFDQWGRRIFTMSTNRGPVNVIQGITEMTPAWTKVEGITHVWDMRIATTNIPRDVLSKILAGQIDPKNIEHRKRIARFYLQSERYEDAYKELEAVLAEFPGDAKVRDQLEPSIRSLKQLAARRLLSELKLRREAGQHNLVVTKLKTFPSEGVAGEILQAVRELVQDYETEQSRRTEVIAQIGQLLAEVKSEKDRAKLDLIVKEIAAELNVNTLGRMASFRQFVGGGGMLPEDKLSLAISGWLMGSDAATVRLPIALSAFEVRQLVCQYLREDIALNRAKILGDFPSQEAATPERVAKILAHMKPPIDSPVQEDKPGYFELEVKGLPKEPPVRYFVQLPPEYDPYRRYPAIVTLNGAGTTAEQQVDWWAGAWTAGGWRSGQASRYGYIVIGPDWTVPHQKQYEYSAREHAAVLACLRDACRRFAVDTDRVFLSGHSIGGDAVWDMGLAHPDLWAGVVPIVAAIDKYPTLYRRNAERLPLYFVCGELDGGRMSTNARDLDHYLTRGYNTTVVEYLGRGHEDFYDEIQRIFDWMGRYRRDFFPKEFEVQTMRQWDNFFWWVELYDLPSRAMVNPATWPPPSGSRPVETKASITSNNGLRVRTGTGKLTVWISPEMVDLKQRVTVIVNGHPVNPSNRTIEPSLEVLLEDARTRSDRQHPFWAKVDAPTGRVSKDD